MGRNDPRAAQRVQEKVEDQMMGVVYLLVNRINKKAYVGMTIQRLGARLSYHLTGKNSYFLLSKALRKYGPENFDWSARGLFRNVCGM